MKISSFPATMLLLVAGTSVLAAQGGGGMGGGMGGRGGGHHHADQGQRQDLEGITTDPVIWNGPPAPVDLPAAIQLSPDQQPRYDTLYDRFMAATKRVRDQAQANRLAFYPAPGQPHTPTSANAVEDFKEQALYLSQKQDVFDQAVETFFTKDQMKEYKKWRKAERKRAEAEQQEHHEDMRGRGRPPS